MNVDDYASLDDISGKRACFPIVAGQLLQQHDLSGSKQKNVKYRCQTKSLAHYVAAKVPVPSGTVIKRSMLVAGMVATTNSVDWVSNSDEAVGKTTKIQLFQGQVLQRNFLISKGKSHL